jgi:hypothetical protein
MLRAAALSLLVLVSVIVMLPTSDSSAHRSGRSSASRHSRMNRRHSRAWWRRWRARPPRPRTPLKRRQSLLRARSETSLNAMVDSHKSAPLADKLAVVSTVKNPLSGWNAALPNGWSRRGASAAGAMKFVMNSTDGRSIGEATLSFSAARNSDAPVVTGRMQRKMLGGVPFTELRRTVIDKMVAANGWVINDLQREIGGRPAFVVVARTAASSDGRTPEQSWVFYFTEVDGRIYTLAANSLPEFAERIADESAQLMASFQASRSSTLVETSLR